MTTFPRGGRTDYEEIHYHTRTIHEEIRKSEG